MFSDISLAMRSSGKLTFIFLMIFNLNLGQFWISKFVRTAEMLILTNIVPEMGWARTGSAWLASISLSGTPTGNPGWGGAAHTNGAGDGTGVGLLRSQEAMQMLDRV